MVSILIGGGCSHSISHAPASLRPSVLAVAKGPATPSVRLVRNHSGLDEVGFVWEFADTPIGVSVSRGGRDCGVTDGFSDSRVSSVSYNIKKVKAKYFSTIIIETRGKDKDVFTSKTYGEVRVPKGTDVSSIRPLVTANLKSIPKNRITLVDHPLRPLDLELWFGKPK